MQNHHLVASCSPHFMQYSLSIRILLFGFPVVSRTFAWKYSHKLPQLNMTWSPSWKNVIRQYSEWKDYYLRSQGATGWNKILPWTSFSIALGAAKVYDKTGILTILWARKPADLLVSTKKCLLSLTAKISRNGSCRHWVEVMERGMCMREWKEGGKEGNKSRRCFFFFDGCETRS